MGIAPPAPVTQPPLSEVLLQKAPGLNKDVLRYALEAHGFASKQGLLKNDGFLTVIDFSLPSTTKRLWTFDLYDGRLIFHDFVAHGMNTGENLAVHFSNQFDSFMSSLGVYLTDEPYIGKNGYSLRLIGLEEGFNDNAYSRAVVLHGAWYVSEEMIQQYGRLGRSYGCPAVRHELATPLIDVIKNGSLLFAYYPQQKWLEHSRFLHSDLKPAGLAAR